MKREMKYKKRHIKSMKISLWLILLGILCLIMIMWLILNKHLYQIQNFERLERFQNYEEFRLDFGDVTNCTNTHYLLYESEEYRFYTNCNHNVDVYFGNTSTSLANALKRGYITFKLLTQYAKQRKYENYIEYSVQSIDESVKTNYVIKLYKEENDKSRVYIEPL